jgi:hypothetical protein
MKLILLILIFSAAAFYFGLFLGAFVFAVIKEFKKRKL